MNHETNSLPALRRRYEGLTAIVSGASSGIGHAIVQGLLAEGATVIATDINEPARDADLPSNFHIVLGDIRKQETIDEVVATAVEVGDGEISALFNNAGISRNSAAVDFTFEDWNQVLDVNLNSAFKLAQAVGRIMTTQRHGAILNTASPAGIAGIPNSLAYVVSKHAIVGLTRGLAVEWGPYGVRTNAICPGLTETGMNERLRADHPERWEAREEINPLRRGATAADQASTALFLNSHEAAYTNGHIAVVDGGQDSLYSGYTVAFR